MNNYTKTWVQSAEKCRPTEDWHWAIMARDYQREYSWIRLAFMGRIVGTTPVFFHGGKERGWTWQEVEDGAVLIAAALGRRFAEHGRPLPYVNSMWRPYSHTLFADVREATG